MGMKVIGKREVHVVEMNPKGERTIVMVHGLLTNLSAFYMKIAPNLAKKYRVVLYDLRGHGLSEGGDEGFSLEVMSNDLLELFAEMNIEKTYLVGYSYGGVIVIHTALRRPEVVESVALIETPSISEPDFDVQINSKEGLRDYIGKNINAMGFAAPMQFVDKTIERLTDLFGDGKLTEAIASGRRVMDVAPLEQLSLPVLLLYGDESAFVETGLKFKERIPGGLFYLGSGGHNLPVSQGDWISGHLEDFFDKCACRGAGDHNESDTWRGA
ncbi:MAG: alpha/beta hydrolase [Oscillospiraceae bacterium]|jgi:pimeloyl-ACP methyl ester carboxylesterase|nr:alpha/beta hydrolase [Oscillospiraceae bacterium]